MPLRFGLAKAFERCEGVADLLIKAVNCMRQLHLNGSRQFPTLFIHLIPILMKNFSAAPYGIDRAGQCGEPGDGASDIQKGGVRKSCYDGRNPAGCSYAGWNPKPARRFSN